MMGISVNNFYKKIKKYPNLPKPTLPWDVQIGEWVGFRYSFKNWSQIAGETTFWFLLKKVEET